ncbi:MAG: hypothetical protein IPG67_15030 [Acidobacteria bacterium]|nr:hypothetical protein [Acidobacteriota bacterium]
MNEENEQTKTESTQPLKGGAVPNRPGFNPRRGEGDNAGDRDNINPSFSYEKNNPPPTQEGLAIQTRQPSTVKGKEEEAIKLHKERQVPTLP